MPSAIFWPQTCRQAGRLHGLTQIIKAANAAFLLGPELTPIYTNETMTDFVSKLYDCVLNCVLLLLLFLGILCQLKLGIEY